MSEKSANIKSGDETARNSQSTNIMYAPRTALVYFRFSVGSAPTWNQIRAFYIILLLVEITAIELRTHTCGISVNVQILWALLLV